MIDLDKTALYGNDGNDLGIALQWMHKDFLKVQELYKLLINPSLRKVCDFYVKQGKQVEVVIYTRRPQIVYYKSCVRHKTLPVRWHDDQGQTCRQRELEREGFVYSKEFYSLREWRSTRVSCQVRIPKCSRTHPSSSDCTISNSLPKAPLPPPSPLLLNSRRLWSTRARFPLRLLCRRGSLSGRHNLTAPRAVRACNHLVDYNHEEHTCQVSSQTSLPQRFPQWPPSLVT